MDRRKALIISSGIVLSVIASLFVGTFYASHGGMSGGTLPSVMTQSGPTSAEVRSDRSTPVEREVIYNAHFSLEANEIQGTLQKIRALAEGCGGYVASSSRSTYGVQARADIAIRVPKDKFQAAIEQIEEYGKVLDEGTTSEDITQQYIDLNAKLNNMQRQEERLREILSIAKTVEEILRVESELERVRGEVDSLQGQINYLEGNVQMSLISVTLTEPEPPFTPPGMEWSETLEIAISGLFTVVRGMIILVISLVPVLVVGVPIYYLYSRRKQRSHQIARQTSDLSR